MLCRPSLFLIVTQPKGRDEWVFFLPSPRSLCDDFKMEGLNSLNGRRRDVRKFMGCRGLLEEVYKKRILFDTEMSSAIFIG